MRQSIDKFFTSDAYAVVGVSRNKNKFGSTAFRELQKRNLKVYPVNPHLMVFDESRCFASVSDLPDEVGSVLIVVPPKVAEVVVAECIRKGIHNVWLQPGSESETVLSHASEHGLNIVHGQCILLYTEPVRSVHAMHRWATKLFGTYAQQSGG